VLLIIEEVIVGHSVHALLKSYLCGIPIVLPSHTLPPIDLKLEHEISIEQLQTRSYSDAWSMLKFLCSMKGLIVNPEDLEYVRVESEIRFRGSEISFQKCHLFPDQKIKTELEVVSVMDQDLYRIIDFMRLKFCDASNLDPVSPEESFISRIESTSKKELYSVSFLTREQLTDFDYSDTMVRFITQKVLLEQDGLHRPLIHRGGTSRRVPKLEVTERVVIPMEETVYKGSSKIKFYDRKKRINIIKTYSRHCSSIEG
jgi:hypothetical protein